VSRYVLDTNLYIAATRSEARERELEAFYILHTPSLYLHSVVAAELLTGAIHPALEKRTHRSFIAPFEAVGRIVTPSHAAWRRAGSIIARLIRVGALHPNGVKPSFFNDCLIAASAREHGFTLITENERDFELIGRVEPLEFTAPWP